jgi:hypothetical protein
VARPRGPPGRSAARFPQFRQGLGSTQSTEEFLRRKIDQKFPAILRGAAGRLELWFSPRESDVQTFARSATTVETGPTSGRAAPVSRDEHAHST